MRYLLAAVILVLPVGASAGAADFCFGDRPSESSLQGQYDSICPDYRAGVIASELQKLEDAKKDKELTQSTALATQVATLRAASIAESEKAAKALAELAKSITPADAAAPSLAAFSSASQRQQANLSELVGREIGKAVSVSLNKTPGLVLVSAGSEVPRLWIESESPEVVITSLQSIAASFGKVSSQLQACSENKVSGWSGNKSLVETVIVGSAAVELIVAGVQAVSGLATTKITGASAVAAPTGIMDAVMSGLFQNAGAMTQLTTRGPLITDTNSVLVELRKTKAAAAKVGELSTQITRPDRSEAEIKLGKKCVESVQEIVKGPIADLKTMETPADPLLGSRVDQAARAAAARGANLKALLSLTPVVSGGAAVSLDPAWFSSPELLYGADIAVAFRLQDAQTGVLLAVGMQSSGCTSKMTIAEFSQEGVYRDRACKAGALSSEIANDSTPPAAK